MDVDLRYLMQTARRRWWIVALLMVLAGASAYASSARQTPLYRTSVTILVTPGQTVQGTVPEEMKVTMQRYARLVSSPEMDERVADALGMDYLPASVSAFGSADTQVLTVIVTDTDPARAALIANTTAQQFQGYVEERARERADLARSGLESQIDLLEEQLNGIDVRLDELPAPEETADPQIKREINDLTEKRGAINDLIISLTTQSLTIDAQTLAGSARVEPASEAIAPIQPFQPQPRRFAILGVFIGFLLGIGAVGVLEYLDNTIKPGRSAQEFTGAPLIATIPIVEKLEPGGRQIYALSDPRSGAAEAIRLLRTNLDFAASSSEIRTLTITSPGPGEGKSTTSANLAVAFAQAGLRTVVIDADLRSPTQATIFRVGSGAGLTTLLRRPETAWTEVARNVAVPGLRLIPSGPIPPNPSDLVGSLHFERLLASIKAEVDWVIIDSPPILAASDALAVAQHTDGLVLVAHSGKTRIDAVRHASDAVHQGGIRLVGVVLNRQKGQHGASIYGEYYGYAPGPFSGNGASGTLPSERIDVRRSSAVTPVSQQDGYR